jgi:hypothetical protein
VVTGICSYGLMSKEKASSEEVRKNHDVANQLSGYCAYLVAFQPELVSSAEVLSVLGFVVRAMIRKIRWALADANYRFDEGERYDSKMASGGEFVTILWALLTNAGILLEVPISSDEGGDRDGMACDSKQSGEPTFVDIVKFCATRRNLPLE